MEFYLIQNAHSPFGGNNYKITFGNKELYKIERKWLGFSSDYAIKDYKNGDTFGTISGSLSVQDVKITFRSLAYVLTITESNDISVRNAKTSKLQHVIKKENSKEYSIIKKDKIVGKLLFPKIIRNHNNKVLIEFDKDENMILVVAYAVIIDNSKLKHSIGLV